MQMNKLLITLFILLQSNLAMAASSSGRWHAGIGDATIFGWATVLAYLIAMLCCFVKARESKRFGGNYQFWLYLAAFLLLLGINKQLDLQSWFTQVMKDSALAHGWYGNRRTMQLVFISILGLSMVIALFSLRLYLANSWRHYRLAWVGVILLCTFILMRAASFHHFDIFINYQILGLKINAVLETGAILLIILGTIFNKKFVNPSMANTVSVREYVDIVNEGDDVRCPECGTQPLSKTVDGRLFKCRTCGYKYTVRVIGS
jgi:DNA-directed RNA polymerase subunit RPC12/RpoP